MANGNPFFVQSAQAAPALQGLASGIRQFGEDRDRQALIDEKMQRDRTWRKAAAAAFAPEGREELLSQAADTPQFQMERAKIAMNPEVAQSERQNLASIGIDTPEKMQEASDFAEQIQNTSDDGIRKAIEARVEKGVAEGRDMSDTAKLAGLPPQEVRRRVSLAGMMVDHEQLRRMMSADPERTMAFIQQGATISDLLRKQEQGPTQEWKFQVVDGELVRTDAATGKAEKAYGPSGPTKELKKEIRSEVRTGLKSTGKAVNTIVSNRDKLSNLATQIKNGNRQAVAQGLVALVKLNDPNSAVLEGEMRSALNTESPLAAVTSVLKDKGTSDSVIQSVTNAIDPLNPEAVNIDDMLATADAMIAANVPSLIQDYESNREKAVAGQLSDAAVKSLFTDSLEKKVQSLESYVKPNAQEEVTETVVTQENIGQKSEEDLLKRLAELEAGQ